MKKYLILADESVFEGEKMGASGESVGEVVFNTSMVGYYQTINDKAYYGQIVTQTFPLIGNYGVAKYENASQPALNGYIAREVCADGSNFLKDTELDAYLIENNIVGIKGIDTRSLTRKLREKGVMNGMIADDIKNMTEKIKQIKSFKIKNALSATTVEEVVSLNQQGAKRVALWDFGEMYNLVNEFSSRGLSVEIIPAFFTAEQILERKPDYIALSSGGGNPSDNASVIAEIAKLANCKIPMFGIGLGAEMIALSFGAKVQKLKYGHRAAQPVKDIASGRIYTTTQNHAYAVSAKSLPNCARITHTNVNDHTVEGLAYEGYPIITTEFEPATLGLSEGTGILFDEFMKLA